jgi:hypothetical protein
MQTDMTSDETDTDAEGGYDGTQKLSDEDLIKESREGLQACIEDESNERNKMLDDLRFATLDQWPADVRAMRENDAVNGARPCLTIDQINQYITQVSNDMRSNRPSIKVRPEDHEGDEETAKIYQGLIRHIEDQSQAQVAYDTSGRSAVTIGLGFVRVVTDYVDADSFDQEILIKRIPDTFSVYLSSHNMPDGSDADKAWVFEKMPIETFKRTYPGKSWSDSDFTGLGVMPTWKTSECVTVCEYFYKSYKKKSLVYLADGRVMTRKEYDVSRETIEVTGERESFDVTVNWCKHTGADVIERRVLKGKYIPVIEEVGKESVVDGKRILWGLVRPAKDSLRAFNYWISAMTEKMALAPKAPFIGAVGQFASQGDKWDKANINNYAKLEYDAIDINGNAVPPPQRQAPMQMEPAMAQMLSIMQNNVKSSLGMYKAAVGEAEAQQSGRAILALKRESDTGTLHFGENQALTIQQVGRIIVDLIPHYYDTKRVVRILGEDGVPGTANIDPDQDGSIREIQDANGSIKRIYNLGVGKYNVTVSVGPSYQTSRQEAATIMTDLANTAKDPISAAILRYGSVKNSDFAGSEEITRMLKAMLPPQLQQADADKGQQPIPPQVQAQMAQMAQGAQQLQAQAQQLAQENQQLKAGASEAQAKLSTAHQESMAELALKAKVQEEELRLQREKVEAEIRLKAWVAEQEIAVKQGVAAADAHMANKSMEHDQLMSRLDSISELLRQFEVASSKQTDNETHNETE